MTTIEIIEGDNTRIKFEAAFHNAGAQASIAFARAMNSEGRKTMTKVKRALIKQTSIKPAMINASIKFKSAGARHLETRIEGRGSAVPLIQFGARETSTGTVATVWGKSQTFPHTFIVSRFNNVYKRLGPSRGPIESLYGPRVPVELVKDESLEAFETSTPQIAIEAMRVLGLMLGGVIR